MPWTDEGRKRAVIARVQVRADRQRQHDARVRLSGSNWRPACTCVATDSSSGLTPTAFPLRVAALGHAVPCSGSVSASAWRDLGSPKRRLRIVYNGFFQGGK